MTKVRLGIITILILATLCCTACFMDKGTEDYNSGVACAKEGNYEKAYAYFSSAVKKNPNEPQYYISYGTTLIQLKRYGEAAVSLSRVLDLENKTEEDCKRVYRGMGIANYYNEKFEKAEENLEKALEISSLPDLNTDLYLYLGKVKEYQKDYKGACAAYEDVIATDATKTSAFVGKYKCEIALSKYSDAEKTLMEGIKLVPATDEDKYMYAMLCFFHNDRTQAKDLFEQTIVLGFAESNLYLGQIYADEDQYDKSVSSFEVYIKESGDKKNILVYTRITECFMEQENYKEAEKWIEKGIDLDETDEELQTIRYYQMMVYKNLGNYKKAYTVAEEYVGIYPNDDRFKTERNELQTLAGNLE